MAEVEREAVAAAVMAAVMVPAVVVPAAAPSVAAGVAVVAAESAEALAAVASAAAAELAAAALVASAAEAPALPAPGTDVSALLSTSSLAFSAHLTASPAVTTNSGNRVPWGRRDADPPVVRLAPPGSKHPNALTRCKSRDRECAAPCGNACNIIKVGLI